MGLFKHHYTGRKQWTQVVKNDTSKDVVVISRLDDPNLLTNIGFFVREVHCLKNDVPRHQSTDTFPTSSPPRQFMPEFEGTRAPYTIREIVTAGVVHGTVVSAFREQAESKGFETWNNRATDLFLQRKQQMAMIEVKTDLRPYSKYTAIGQLLYHGRAGSRTYYQLVAVFPKIDKDFKKILEGLGIVGVTYDVDGCKCKFGPELDVILSL